jgi:hypothetical protein
MWYTTVWIHAYTHTYIYAYSHVLKTRIDFAIFVALFGRGTPPIARGFGVEDASYSPCVTRVVGDMISNWPLAREMTGYSPLIARDTEHRCSNWPLARDRCIYIRFVCFLYDLKNTPCYSLPRVANWASMLCIPCYYWAVACHLACEWPVWNHIAHNPRYNWAVAGIAGLYTYMYVCVYSNSRKSH